MVAVDRTWTRTRSRTHGPVEMSTCVHMDAKTQGQIVNWTCSDMDDMDNMDLDIEMDMDTDIDMDINMSSWKWTRTWKWTRILTWT
jgi:hypothetical protein